MDIQNKTNEDYISVINESQKMHKEFLRGLITGNQEFCYNLVLTSLKKQISIKDLYEDIITKALYELGELWEFNKISVATEHLASAIVESILNQLYFEIISKEPKNKTVIASCVENEFHQIGIKMISDIFELNGWSALFLGSNTPTSDLISFIKLSNPDLLAISLSMYYNLPTLETMLQTVRRESPHLPILLGGQAFRHGGKDIVSKYENVVFKTDLTSTELFIKNLK